MASHSCVITPRAIGHAHVTATILLPDDPKQSYPPAPPWRVNLKGEEKDLQDLVSEHSVGPSRLIHAEEDYFLESDILNGLRDPNEVYRKANKLLQIMRGLARVRRFEEPKVEAVSVVWTDGNGNWVCRMLFVSKKVWAVSGIRFEGLNNAEIISLAETNEAVRMSLIDFLGDCDLPSLRRIKRHILLDLGGGGIRKGAKELVRLGWATEQECARFNQSVNFGDKEYNGAHSPLELAQRPNSNHMNLVEAVEFVRMLLARWLAWKTNSNVISRNEGLRMHDPKPRAQSVD